MNFCDLFLGVGSYIVRKIVVLSYSAWLSEVFTATYDLVFCSCDLRDS
jgi:hypothetical protein